jgi:hypothetical protein
MGRIRSYELAGGAILFLDVAQVSGVISEQGGTFLTVYLHNGAQVLVNGDAVASFLVEWFKHVDEHNAEAERYDASRAAWLAEEAEIKARTDGVEEAEQWYAGMSREGMAHLAPWAPPVMALDQGLVPFREPSRSIRVISPVGSAPVQAKAEW